jgi:DNA-binding NarL/FixJ family response regulator
MTPRIRILIVDDHFTARIGLRVPLAAEPDLEVVSEAQNAAEAVDFYHRDRPDVVIMDYKLPDMTGVAAIAKIRGEFPEARVLMLTVFDGEEDIHRAVSAGALGYLTKSAGLAELLHAVRTVAEGLTYYPPEVAARLEARRRRGTLTTREEEILHHLVRGRSNKEIANAMDLSLGTIALHVSRILEKLGAVDRTRAATLAIERGIVRLG